MNLLDLLFFLSAVAAAIIWRMIASSVESFVVVFAVLVSLWLVARRLVAGTRSKALRQIAEAMGFSYQMRDDRLWEEPFCKFPLFNQGSYRRIYNVLRGEWGGRHVLLFDYEFTTGGGDSQSTHYTSVAAIRLREPQPPNFQSEPEGLVQRLVRTLASDVNFPSDPNLPKTVEVAGNWLIGYKSYRVKEDKAEIRGFLEGAVQDALDLENTQLA